MDSRANIVAVASGVLLVASVAVLGFFGIQGSLLGDNDYEIDGEQCSTTGSDSFECPIWNGPHGDYQEQTGATISEEEAWELDENGANRLLREYGVLQDDRDGAGAEFNSENWIGFCEYTVSFEDDDERFHEVRIEGELVDADAGLACELNSPSTQEVELTNCDADSLRDEFIRRRGGEEEACRADLSNVHAEYGSVEYILRSDADGDGVFDRNDECPQVAGELENGCPNTVPTVSVSVPGTVEDESEFAATAEASDVEAQNLSYTWSNGDTGAEATYSFPVSGVNRTVSVEVSDGIDFVSKEATVRVIDNLDSGSTGPDEDGSSGTTEPADGSDEEPGGLLDFLIRLLTFSG